MNIKNIEEKIINNIDLTEEEINFFLTYTCNQVNKIVNHPTYENTCDLIQGLIGRYFKNLGIKIFPCITNKCISPYVIGHSFIVAQLNNEYYLIDPSFIQFLILNDNYDDLYINHLRVKSKSPFFYAKEINENLLLNFLKKGYSKLTDEFAYMYGNSFYKTKTNILDSTVLNKIPANIIINNFLKGEEKLRKYNYSEINPTIKK